MCKACHGKGKINKVVGIYCQMCSRIVDPADDDAQHAPFMTYAVERGVPCRHCGKKGNTNGRLHKRKKAAA